MVLVLCAWYAAAPADTLRFGVSNLPPTMGNPYGANGTPSSYTWAAMFDALTRLDAQGDLQPALATDWSLVDTDRWRFELRAGVHFDNGEPFDAEAVVAVFDWLRSSAGARTVIGNEVRHVARVEVVDTHTVDVITEAPDAILPQRLSAVFMVPPRAWAELGPDGFARAPSGTGPFRLERWSESDRRVHLVARDDGWRRPQLSGLEVIALPDQAVRVQALRSREIDLTMVDIEDVDFLRARGFHVRHSPSMQVMALAFNVERDPPSPVADPRVRRALNLAVNREAIAGILMQGLVEPSSQPASRVTVGHDPELAPFPHDPDAARALLAEAGHGEGLTLSIEVAGGGAPGASQIYQVVVQDLARVGVRARLRVRPFSAWLRDYLAGRLRADLFGLAWNAAPYNDVMRPMEYYSCAKRQPFYCDPELMPLLEAAQREMDPDRRAALLRELAREIRERVPALFLVEQIDLFAYRDGVAGFGVANRVPVYEQLQMVDRAAH